MISVVCINNNDKILSQYLLKSLENQTLDYELITVDNTKGAFKSAAEALNHGGKKAKGKYIMFVHNDVDLLSNEWLEEAEKMVDSISNLGIAGVAGMSESGSSNSKRGRNIITHGKNFEIWSWGNIIQKPEPVQTLDECLVIIPKSTFDILEFDEKVCDDWHLYVVDYCLSIKILGFDTYVIPQTVYHRSSGYSMSEKYYVTLKKVLNKHKQNYRNVYTTMGDWCTSYPLIFQRIRKKLKCIQRTV